MASVQHQRACWYVGCLDGRVVTSLGAYPLLFQVRGQQVPGFAIGAVHTVRECRKRGYAAALMAWVEEHQRRQGAQLGLLYSDIDPDYYARMGYRLCQCWEGGCTLTPAVRKTKVEQTLRQFSPGESLARVDDVYRRAQVGRSVWIERSPEYWEWLLARSPADNWYWWGETEGYVRVSSAEKELRIVDWSLVAAEPEREVEFWASVVDLAARRSKTQVGGWFPRTTAIVSCFSLQPRQLELTMLKPLSSETAWEDSMGVDAAWFVEVDHV